MRTVAVGWLFVSPDHSLHPVDVQIVPPDGVTHLVGWAIEMEQYLTPPANFLTTQLVRGALPPDPTTPPGPTPLGPYVDTFLASVTTKDVALNQDVELTKKCRLTLDLPLTVRYYCGGPMSPQNKGGSFFTILRFV